MAKKKVLASKRFVEKENDYECDFRGVCRVPPETLGQTKEKPVRRMSDLSWRIFRIMGEFVQGFQFLSNFDREVSVFGSARLKPGTKWYKEAEIFGALCAQKKLSIITGGGPGIMEAANKGAFEAGGESIGINIQLPTEQRINPYVQKSMAFHYFFTRKVMLAASAQAYIFFPGGIGTTDEFFEIIELIQTNKMAKIPIVCVGKEFWQPVLHLMNLMIDMETINAEDKKIFTVVNSGKEAYELIKDSEDRDIF